MKNDMIYKPAIVCTEENYATMWEKAVEENGKKIKEIENKAIAQSSLLYRFLYEGVADGVATYQIVKVNKNTVHIRLCIIDGLFADYVVPQWGTEATISKEYAEKGIRAQDMWNKITAQRSVSA